MRAKQAGVAILGGEPPLSEEVQALQTQGYSIPDMCSYYFLRQIPQYKRENNPLVENPEALLEAFMQRMHAGLPAIQEQDLSYSQFLTVFKERLGVDFDIASITPTLVRGENEPGSNFFQKIGHHVGLRRDPNLLRVIDEALEQNACVMVAYGAGHLVTLRPALEAGLGASVDSQPFPPGVLPRLFPEGMGAANEAVKQGRKATRAEDPPPRP